MIEIKETIKVLSAQEETIGPVQDLKKEVIEIKETIKVLQMKEVVIHLNSKKNLVARKNLLKKTVFPTKKKILEIKLFYKFFYSL